MGEHQTGPNYTGMDKYPGWVATVITIVIGAVFLGALYNSAGHHEEGHGADHSTEHPEEKAQ